MLRMLRLAFSACLLVLATSITAHAELVCAEYEMSSGACLGWVEIPGSGGGSSGNEGGSGGGGAPSEPRVCTFGGREIPCQGKFGTWFSGREMWCAKLDPQPPYSDPAWRGNSEGAIYSCVRPEGSGVPDASLSFTTWLPPGVQASPPDPEAMARRLLARIEFRAIDIGISLTPLSTDPEAMGVVHMPVWFWAEHEDAESTGPVTSSATEAGHTVSITARLSAVDWDLGDGSGTIRCTGWRRFDPATMDRHTPVACGSQEGYTREGEFTVSATSRWVVEWSGIGQSGTLEFPLRSEEPVRIGEAHTLHTAGGR